MAEKLKTRNIEEVSDLLRARIDVDTIDQARAVAQDVKNTVKTIEFDDFLKLKMEEDLVIEAFMFSF